MTFIFSAFHWRKPGMSPEEFKSYYDNVHIPLLVSLLGTTFPISHTRNYVARTTADPSASDPSNSNHPATVLAGEPDYFDYDCYSVLVFEDEARFGAFYKRMSDPEVDAKIEEDKKNFLGKMKAVMVEPSTTKRPEA